MTLEELRKAHPDMIVAQTREIYLLKGCLETNLTTRDGNKVVLIPRNYLNEKTNTIL